MERLTTAIICFISYFALDVTSNRSPADGKILGHYNFRGGMAGLDGAANASLKHVRSTPSLNLNPVVDCSFFSSFAN